MLQSLCTQKQVLSALLLHELITLPVCNCKHLHGVLVCTQDISMIALAVGRPDKINISVVQRYQHVCALIVDSSIFSDN